MSSPKVSIIIPSYNHRPYIGALIDSIYAQTYKNFELIVVDDGSKDGSPDFLKELLKKYNFQLIVKENEGLCATLNRGLSIASGELIINIGSDDILPPNRLSEQVEYLVRHTEVDVVAGCLYLIDEKGTMCGKKIPAKMGNITFEDMVVTNRVFAPSAMIRKAVFEQVGLYPKDYIFEDYYLWLKILSSKGVIHNTNHFWAYYRISNVNLEKKFNWYYKGAVQVLSAYSGYSSVRRQLGRNRFIYCIKLALLLGRYFREKYFSEYQLLSFAGRSFVRMTSLLPYLLRNKVLVILKLKVE